MFGFSSVTICRSGSTSPPVKMARFIQCAVLVHRGGFPARVRPAELKTNPPPRPPQTHKQLTRHLFALRMNHSLV